MRRQKEFKKNDLIPFRLSRASELFCGKALLRFIPANDMTITRNLFKEIGCIRRTEHLFGCKNLFVKNVKRKVL